MNDLILGPTVRLWIPQATAAQMRQGAAREQAEQEADESFERGMATPCPGCGKPVKDADYERHRRVDHADNEVAQPAGKPDARELLLLAYDAADMDRKLQTWRSRHPGIHLEASGDGTRENGRIIYRRWRIFDGKGRPAE